MGSEHLKDAAEEFLFCEIVDSGERQDVCRTPISEISTAHSSSVVSELQVDFTSCKLKTEVGNWPCLPSTTNEVAPQQQLDPMPTSTRGDSPPRAPATSRKLNMGSYTQKTVDDLEAWLDTAESDGEVDVADTDIDIDGQIGSYIPENLTPAHVMDELNTDLQMWMSNDDQVSDNQITQLMPDDHLTFDWSLDHNSFKGKRETFIGPAGPTFPVTDETTPLDIFFKFFDTSFFNLLVEQTNKYATRQIDLHLTPHSRLNFYKNVDRDDMARFLAILILQGLVSYPVEKNYWVDYGHLTLKQFKDILPYNRFVLMKRLLHFSDLSDTDTTLSVDERKLRKIRPVLDFLQKKFSSLYLPQQDIAIDESLLKWHGRLSFAQRIATKAAKVGVKSYELCESTSGYLWSFFVYTGKKDEQTDDRLPENTTDNQSERPTDRPPLPTNVTSKIVHDLAKPLYNRGHTLIMDNFYNSPLLARYLKSQGTDCYGTLRVNREFVPESIKTVQKQDLREGELVQSFTSDLSIVMWRDSNVVSLLSTYHEGEVGGIEKYGRYKYKPQVVLDYNRAMGGVDKKDQLLSAFPIERVRNVVWYKKVFRRLLNATLLNCHIIFKTHAPNLKCSPREFRRQVAEGLIRMSKPPVVERPIHVDVVKIAAARKPNKVRPILKGNHFIGTGPFKVARCEWCLQSRTKYICKQCNVSLCLEMCFEQFHTKP